MKVVDFLRFYSSSSGSPLQQLFVEFSVSRCDVQRCTLDLDFLQNPDSVLSVYPDVGNAKLISWRLEPWPFGVAIVLSIKCSRSKK